MADLVETYKGGDENQCRLLLGMYAPGWQFKKELLYNEADVKIDNSKARKLRSETLKKFKNQLMMGTPSNEDEKGLRQLAHQLKEKKLVVKCFTRHPLHAKLYLTFNQKDFAGKIGFVGSSNLTYAGLEKNGELNIDVLDQESLVSLSNWFEDKWQDQFSIDISDQIAQLIEESWAGSALLSPYYIYMKMAWHLSEDARKGLTGFFIPKELKNVLFDFQSAAVRIAARYLYYKNGVLIGDVVGLGKTLMAIATAKILEEEQGFQSLVLCPKNLQEMWEDQRQKWGLRGTVLPISQVQQKLPSLRRHQIVILDESHNLRNPNGKRYQVVKDYIVQNDSKCILLSATPYNKTYKDLSSQLGLFIDRDVDLGIQPNRFLTENGGKFEGHHSTLKAFEESPYSEDWQQLMARFLVRRTRSFIKENYGKKDQRGKFYIETSKGGKKFFPERSARTIRYAVDEQYQRLFSEEVVNMIAGLKLARYDLIQYKKNDLQLQNLTNKESEIFKDLKQSRGYPKGFCRINLFKRLESSGYAFLQSVQRHILRNCIFIYAIETGQALMIGEKSSEAIADAFDDKEGGIAGFQEESDVEETTWFLDNFNSFYKKAEEVYKRTRGKNSRSLRWISSSYWTTQLKEDLRKDTDQFISLLKKSKSWKPEKDLKLKKLEDLIKTQKKTGDQTGEKTKKQTGERKKILIFTQSRETAGYLRDQLKNRGVKNLGLITGGMKGVQNIVKRFSPKSNQLNIKPSSSYNRSNQLETQSNESKLREGTGPEIDILITTDVLSEGQNLQDCNTVINYDLPWAVIKLIQRVGRVDRIGQAADKIFCLSFMPDEELERLINLRGRIKQRLKDNAELIGTDERFFENERQILVDLYNEKSETLEREISEDIDLSSFALGIWNKGIKKDPTLEEKIKNLPDVVHATKAIQKEEGVLLFAKSHVHHWLMYLNKQGECVREDSMDILKLAECKPEIKPLKRSETHYETIQSGLKIIQKNLNRSSLAGRMGSGRNPRRKLFERLDSLATPDEEIKQMMDDIYHYPLTFEAEKNLKRMFMKKRPDSEIFNLSRERYENETLVNKKEAKRMDEPPQIICSMGLSKKP